MSIEERILKIRDGERIALDYHRCGSKKVVVLAHGFYNNKDAFLFKNIAKKLAEYYDVISFDFRGHGKTSGLFSWTSDEPNDLAAVLIHAKDQGNEQ